MSWLPFRKWPEPEKGIKSGAFGSKEKGPLEEHKSFSSDEHSMAGYGKGGHSSISGFAVAVFDMVRWKTSWRSVAAAL